MTWRSALIPDIHGNLPALEAVLEDIERRGLEASYHLGDLVGYGPWPDEVVALLAARGIGGVAGNYDSTVATGADHCGCRSESPAQEALAHESYAWTCARVSDETRRALGALPFRLDLRPAGGHHSGPTLFLIHGAATLNTLYWDESRRGLGRAPQGRRPARLVGCRHLGRRRDRGRARSHGLRRRARGPGGARERPARRLRRGPANRVREGSAAGLDTGARIVYLLFAFRNTSKGTTA